MKMLEESYSPDDVMIQIYRGERVPKGPEQWTLSKSLRRTFLKDQNRFRRYDWEYESEDDEGEDIGEMGDEDADQQAAAGEGGAAKTEEKGEEKKEGGGGGDKEDKK